MKLRVVFVHALCVLVILVFGTPAPTHAQSLLKKIGNKIGIKVVKNGDSTEPQTQPKDTATGGQTQTPPSAPASPTGLRIVTATSNAPTPKDAVKTSVANPTRTGVYLISGDKYIPLKYEAFGQTELAQSKMGGIFNYRALGNKGFLDGLHADTVLPSDAEFVLVIPTSASITGAKLILFDLNSKENRREYRTKTDGWGKLGLDKKNLSDFSFKEIGRHSYQLRIKDPKPGEYGFLAYNELGVASMYPFSIK